MQPLILILWLAGITARGLASIRLWRNGVVRRLWALWALLAITTLQSAVGLLSAKNGAFYAKFYSATAWIVMLFEIAAPVGVFWAMAEYCPRFRRPGLTLLSM